MAPASKPCRGSQHFPLHEMGSAGSIALVLPPAGWVVIPATPLHARWAYLLLRHGSLCFVSSLEQRLTGCGGEELIPFNLLLPYRGLWLEACICCC